jgi:hypothetical protein
MFSVVGDGSDANGICHSEAGVGDFGPPPDGEVTISDRNEF